MALRKSSERIRAVLPAIAGGLRLGISSDGFGVSAPLVFGRIPGCLRPRRSFIVYANPETGTNEAGMFNKSKGLLNYLTSSQPAGALATAGGWSVGDLTGLIA